MRALWHLSGISLVTVVRLVKYSFASSALLLAAVVTMGGMNLAGYHRFTSETPVGSIAFKQTAAQTFQAVLRTPDGATRDFVLKGDEWQLDVRMIKWRDWLTFLGEDPLFRLDRLSGRYVSTEETLNNAPTAHALGDGSGFDVWAFARSSGDWLPGIDAAYGSSVFLPMRDGARYQVTISPTGLLARAVTGTEET